MLWRDTAGEGAIKGASKRASKPAGEQVCKRRAHLDGAARRAEEIHDEHEAARAAREVVHRDDAAAVASEEDLRDQRQRLRGGASAISVRRLRAASGVNDGDRRQRLRAARGVADGDQRGAALAARWAFFPRRRARAGLPRERKERERESEGEQAKKGQSERTRGREREQRVAAPQGTSVSERPSGSARYSGNVLLA